MRFVFGALAAFALLSGCGSSEDPKEGAKPTLDAKAIAEAEAVWPQEKLPAGAPPAPVTGLCMADTCEAMRAQFARRDWPKAWQGDYQGQRNVAFCRSTGCEGSVATNKVEACAWRSVILVAHVGETDDTDTRNLKSDCGGLDDAEATIATGTAKQIYEKIYGKKMARVGG